jgi:hypothetical protein
LVVLDQWAQGRCARWRRCDRDATVRGLCRYRARRHRMPSPAAANLFLLYSFFIFARRFSFVHEQISIQELPARNNNSMRVEFFSRSAIF